MPITRTPIIDDDGTGTTGTVLDNAWKQQLYDQIDGMLNSLALTGTPTAPTAPFGTNTTQLATTAFVQAATGATAGSFLPTLVGDGGGTPTYSQQVGSYRRIGTNLCFVSFQVGLSSKGSLTGYALLANLPFPSVAVAYLPIAWEGITGNPQMLMAQFGAGGNAGYLRASYDGSSSFINNAITVSQLTNSTILAGSFVYAI